MILLCFFGLFRKAEVSFKRAEEPTDQRMLTWRDVEDHGTYLQVFLRNSKADRFGTGQLVVVGARQDEICPVYWFRLYIQHSILLS